ncbi:MAG TPA: MBL fold metallo-hydrolase [Nocardia sp.]|uniref:MBL fold metallo-hydrolase n=1 Tax=Nocardia sp. TaxID=1821 RepID=UPI002B4ADE16|nr:MBL fold metallo-hydrolase [Nocardia sp.]HLS77001.1 MBL fold metallo-hydrolase [Nocardia sp.]
MKPLLLAAGAAAAAWAARAAWDIPSAMGASVSAIKPYAGGTANYRGDRFHNTEPSTQLETGSVAALLLTAWSKRKEGHPARPVPVVRPRRPDTVAELAVTWYGHASALVEVDGFLVLTDPVWSKRVSPSSVVGPARLHPMPLPVDELPEVDVVVISHDHYDHLDKATVAALVDRQSAPFVVPLGIGAHLRHWGVPEHRIVELAWGESVSLSALGRERDGADLTLTCTEARHFSGRGLVRNTTLWAAWTIAGPTKRVYFGGDTGYTKAFAEAGAAHGPFDLTLLPIGAYGDQWPDIHMNPEEAVRAHGDLCLGDAGHGLLVPIHWATFNLAMHGWSEPVRRLVEAAAAAGTPIAVPKPGERVDPASPPPVDPWWESIG